MLAVVALSSLIGPRCASAETLSCTVFKARLDQAMREGSAHGTTPLTFTRVGDGAASGTRYDWSGGPGLSGKLTCGPDDAFADFYMMIDPATRPSIAVPADISRFTDLGAASICALSAGSPPACQAMMTAMTQDGIDQYEEDLAHHDPQPQSLQDYDFAKDLDAVFYVTPRTMSWAIGPGLFTTVEAERPALAPVDRDKGD
jgi:hypothetical protein